MKKALIYIYDYIGSEAVNANYIRQIVSQYEDQGYNEFELHISSMGGSVFEGIAIYNFLKSKSVEVYVEGIAASIASVIAMCGRKIYMNKSSMMMIHNPWLWEGGEADEMRKKADMLDQIKSAIVEAYKERTRLSKSELEKMMDEETWLNAAECVKKGFADEVLKASTAKNYIAVYAMTIDDEIPNKNKDKKMTKEFLAKLGLPETATEAEALARIAEINAGRYELKNDVYVKKEEQPVTKPQDKTETTPSDKKDELSESVKALTTQVTELMNKTKDAEVIGLVDAAINDCKILPKDRDIYITAAKADFAGTKAKLDACAKNSVKPGTVTVNKETGEEKPQTSADKVKAAADAFKAQGRVPQAAKA
jgi:ATP-dependent protease ClpP protease subunit